MLLSISRRRFVRLCAALPGTVLGRGLLRAQAGAGGAELVLPAGGAGAQAAVPKGFIGLSYEVMQLEDPGFFSAANVGLVARFRELAPHGVLRLGGNTSEFSWWKETPTTAPPERPAGVRHDGEPEPETIYAVTPEAIRNLGEFLRAAGWTCIYGLNLGYGTAAGDSSEARVVARELGDRLEYFQIGNEVDLFTSHLRDKATWNPRTYLDNWLELARAVGRAVPSARFGMPDVASDVTWLPKIAAMWPGVADKPRVTMLSHHYYFGGPPANPAVNVTRLLQPDPKVARDAALGLGAAAAMGVGLRMTEGNTCYQAGKPGVSDVFASALWSAAYAFELMTMGYAGVNLHGGSGRAVAVSVGGMLRGEKLMADPEADHAKPFYTPIANVGTMKGSGTSQPLNGEYRLQPVGEGLRFAGSFAEARMRPVVLKNLPGDGTTCRAFAAERADGKTLVAVLNNSGTEAVSLRCPECTVLRVLSGASLTAPVAVWSTPEARRTRRVEVAAASAVLLLVQENRQRQGQPQIPAG